jgi:hypothetical protein
MARSIQVAVVGVAIALVSGCQEQQLQTRTTALAATTTDLVYQQVVDNLARLAASPTALPYLDIPATGTAQIQLSVQAGYTPEWNFITSGAYIGRWLFEQQEAVITGGNTRNESWAVSTVSSPDHLRAMQAAYRTVLGIADIDDQNVLDRYYALHTPARKGPSPVLPGPSGVGSIIASETGSVVASFDQAPSKGASGFSPMDLGIDYRAFLATNWFGLGKPPKNACYVGRCRDTCVWVTSDHLSDLTKFTLAILDIATFVGTTPSGNVVRQPNFIASPPPAILP